MTYFLSPHGTATQAWEATNHVGALGWEGHCWGWCMASVSKQMTYKKKMNRGSVVKDAFGNDVYETDATGDIIPDPVSGIIAEGKGSFSKWEARALYTELGDNASTGSWHYLVSDIPAGPATTTVGEPIDDKTQDVHNALRDTLLTNHKAMTANLRNDKITAEWYKDYSTAPPTVLNIPGVSFVKIECDAGNEFRFVWEAVSKKLTFQWFNGGGWITGTAITVATNGDFPVTCPVLPGRITIQIAPASLPGADLTRNFSTNVEIWNHALFKYRAKFQEAPGGNKDYVEIEMTVYGNKDTPFPSKEGSFVSRKMAYRLTYVAGETTTANQNWVACELLPPSYVGTVKDEATFGWYSNTDDPVATPPRTGVTKTKVDGF